jgi:hypothetical protein
MTEGTRMTGRLVDKKRCKGKKQTATAMPPSDSRSGARAGAQRGVSVLEKIMIAFMEIP